MQFDFFFSSQPDYCIFPLFCVSFFMNAGILFFYRALLSFAPSLLSPWMEIPLDIHPVSLSGSTADSTAITLQRPRISLALSGGGARGLAHIGVLKVLDSRSIPIDGIAGTSMGAVVGGLYSLGYSAAQIESLAYHIEWDRLLIDSPQRQQLFLSQKDETTESIFQVRLKGLTPDIPSAWISGQKLTATLSEAILLAPSSLTRDFNRLPIPLRIVTTDLVSGRKVVLSEGNLISAMRASLAIPLLFTPVEMDSMLLVDGGLVQNLPVEEAREFGNDLIIAVDASSKPRELAALKAPWQIADQVTTIMQKEQLQEQLKLADIALTVDLMEYSNTDFRHIHSIIKRGEEAAVECLPQIEALLDRPEPDSLLTVSRISLSGINRLDKRLVTGILNLTPGRLLFSRILWAGRALHQTGFFEDVRLYYCTETHVLLFQLTENPPVNRIRLTGNHVLSDSLIRTELTLRPGVLNSRHVGRDCQSIVTLYKKQGLVLARVDTTILSPDGTLTYFIHEGMIRRIGIMGNQHTHPSIIQREWPIRAGDVFILEQAQQGIENIYSTRYFESVRYDLNAADDGFDLNIQIDEHSYRLLRWGVRYDLERRTSAQMELVEENLMGRGGKLSVKGILGRKDEYMQVRLWSDRLFNTLFTYDISAETGRFLWDYYRDLEVLDNYKQTFTRGMIILGRQMRRLGTLSIKLASEKVRLNPELDAAPRENLLIRTLTIRSEVDTRNKTPFPDRGERHILESRFSIPYLGSDVTFTRLFSSMELFYSPHPILCIHPRITWGSAGYSVPLVEYFTLGGLHSFMGLPERAVYGKRLFVLNTEIVFNIPLLSWLEPRLHLRYDFGGAWRTFSRIKWEDLKSGTGVILSVNSPLGPIYAGRGFHIDGHHQWYLSAGRSFSFPFY